MTDIHNYISLIPNFPKESIQFRHIGPLLKNPKAFNKCIDSMITKLGPLVYDIDVIAGLDARGFIFSTALQMKLGLPQIMIRKESKTPGKCYKQEYTKEYGTSILELEETALSSGQKVLIVDDLLATAGTLNAAGKLVEQAGAIPFIFLCPIELIGLNGRSLLLTNFPNATVHSLLEYSYDSESLIPNNFDKNIITEYKNTEYKKPEYQNYEIENVLMYHPTMKSIADKILCFYGIRESVIDWKYFPDNWPNIKFEPSSTLNNKNVIFIMNLAKKEVFLEQLSLLIALPRQLIKSLTILIPYLGPSTHERVDYSGMLATAEPVLKIISSCIPPTKTGNPVIRMYDIHALQERFYTNDKITLKLMTAIDVLKNHLKDQYKPNSLVIVFPDDGAYKRFKYNFNNFPQIVCSKTRINDLRKIMIKDYYNINDIKNYKNFLIIDDIAQSGNTLIECCNALKELLGSDINVSAYITHSVFPNNCWKKLENHFGSIITTNTNPEVSDILEKRSKFKVIDISTHFYTNVFSDLYPNEIPNTTIREHKNIYVATTNESKLKAVYKRYNNYKIYSVSGIDSNVNEQPFGKKEIIQGARNRADKCIEILKNKGINKGWVIAIEHGIVESLHEFKYLEALAIVIKCIEYGGNTKDDDYNRFDMVFYDEIIDITEYIDLIKIVKNNNFKITFGSLYEKEYNLEKDAWFEHMTGKTRDEYIKSYLRPF